MQNNGFILCILMMSVLQPIGTFDVNLDIAGPQQISDFNHSLLKIGSGILVRQSGMNNLQWLTIAGFEIEMGIDRVFPRVVEECFRDHGSNI
jgi:hypothetical protein